MPKTNDTVATSRASIFSTASDAEICYALAEVESIAATVIAARAGHRIPVIIYSPPGMRRKARGPRLERTSIRKCSLASKSELSLVQLLASRRKAGSRALSKLRLWRPPWIGLRPVTGPMRRAGRDQFMRLFSLLAVGAIVLLAFSTPPHDEFREYRERRDRTLERERPEVMMTHQGRIHRIDRTRSDTLRTPRG
jgi:hypothetical protein